MAPSFLSHTRRSILGSGRLRKNPGSGVCQESKRFKGEMPVILSVAESVLFLLVFCFIVPGTLLFAALIISISALAGNTDGVVDVHAVTMPHLAASHR